MRHCTRKSVASGIIAGAVTILAASAGVARADPVADFYRDKIVNLTISTGPGGGYDVLGRAFARHFSKHIPGTPNVIVQNMPGAGGLRATNFLYNGAPSDGTALGFVHASMISADLLSPEGAKFKGTRFSWIGNMGGEPGFCVAWHTSPVKAFEDIRKHPFAVGSTGAGAGLDFFPRIINNLFGTKIKIVAGYKGGTNVLLAMERGEVDGICSWPMSGMETTRPTWLPGKKISLLVQFGPEKHPRAPQVPLILDLVSDLDAKAALELLVAERKLLRPVLGPPGMPKGRLEALRRAFMATMSDPAFRADAKNLNKDEKPSSGAEVQTFIERLHRISPRVIKQAIDLKS
ncbi:MAG: Bug family tripartite tricarboxylate transporter substrate binding protein [Xanthobacteraceae bacterium]